MMIRLLALFFLIVASPAGAFAPEDSELNLRSIPISEWLNAGEAAEIPWRVTVRDAQLRMDQRLEVTYIASINSKDLNRSGSEHDLYLVSRISSPDAEWLNEPIVLRNPIEKELPKNVEAQFLMRVSVQPGDYLLWLVLYDRKTGKHNVAKRRVKVPEIRNDPLPAVYQHLPLVEFPQPTEDGGLGFLSSELFLPVKNRRPLEIQLISTLSPPEQWANRGRMVRNHNNITIGALAALSQLELDEGSVSVTGLDLSRHEVLFEQKDFQKIDWRALTEALVKANSTLISAKALEGRKSNGAFFREVLAQRLALDSSSKEQPLRVIIVVTSSMLFEKGSDLEPLQLEGDCHCRIYHFRFRLNYNDVFDQLANFMKPLRPRTFNLITPQDLRKAIAEVIEDLRNL
jgi:hypothetical protein